MKNVEKLVRLLIKNNLTLATAESLTGGMLSSRIVGVPGASHTFVEGFVTYSADAKKNTLGVGNDTIERYGTISRACALAMAKGAAFKSKAKVSMATTGNAGPLPSEDKPVGLVYTAVNILGKVKVTVHHFEGTRSEIRRQTVDACIAECLSGLNELF